MENITISTGAITRPHQVIDAVIAVEQIEAGRFSTMKANHAFEEVKAQLRQMCQQLEGDAIINCRFQYHLAANQDLKQPDPAFQVFAYGTVIKLLE